MARAGGLLTELQAGRGQILLLVGEAGIGKTRLLAELRAGVSGSVMWLEGRCLSYGGDQLSWPFVEMLRGWLGLQPGEPEVAVRMRLRAKLGGLFGPQADRVLPYLGRLLSVRLDPEFESRLAAATPEALAAETRRAYLDWIERLAERQPLVVALDDAHWADPSTRALAEDLLEVTDRAPLMVAAALRPDTASEGWALRLKALSEYQHRAEEVTLGPLSREASLQLADAILPAGVLDEVIKEGMVLRAEGNPLYLEELLRSMVEGGGLDRGRSWTLTISTGQLLPSSLESLFVARIDRLPPGARSLAQVAAVIGRNFPVRVLDEVGESDDLQGDLAVLLRAGMVRELRRYPELECTFKHGLLQEAALSTLPKARQRELYGRVAAAFERLYAGSLEDHLEVLAFDYYRSDDDAKALQYLERAGSKAAGLNAADQATELWTRAQKVASKLGDDEAGRRLAERLSAVRPEQG